MKLVRFGAAGSERPGIWLEHTPAPGKNSILDVRAMAGDIADYDAHFFTHWGLERLRALLAEDRLKLVSAEGVRLGPPVARLGKIVCVGKNYRDHIMEFDAQVPPVPVFFSKATTSVIGPYDEIRLPAGSRTVDGEAELAVVIGAPARDVPEAQALDCVAGYMVFNDVTDRDAQREGQQWFRGKSMDTFCPLGPFLVTRDEVPDPHALRIWSRIDGRTLQDGNTGQMMRRIPELIAFLSRQVTLEPGDVIATGTPGGIGSARHPPVLLAPGATVETGVGGLGQQRNPVR